jgi:ADP-ribosyl-[dinitrogen reductase] hydrolase
MNVIDRYRGCLLGLAAGDALGTTLEFKPPGTFEPITEIIGGGPFRLKPGEWTDDTSMALCLADSLITCVRFDAHDQMTRYVRWYQDGYFSCTGRCFDIGVSTSGSLHRFTETGDPFAGLPDGAGNGCIMRLAPVPLFFAGDPALAIKMAGESARTTHGAVEAVDAARYFAGLIVGALQVRGKDELLAGAFDPTPAGDCWLRQPLAPKIAEIASGSFKRKEPPEIEGRGYVVPCLEAALWAFDRGTNFADIVRLAANLDDDADTTAAVAGQLAGAYYGVAGIPDRWLRILAMRTEIEGLADRLCEQASGKSSGGA